MALLCVLASTASAVVVRAPGGKFFGIAPHAGVDPALIPGSLAAKRARSSRFSANGSLDDHLGPDGLPGPVLHSSAPYLIFWDPGNQISTSSRALLERYFIDVAADSGKGANVHAVARQYTDSTGFADYKQTFNPTTQVISDTQTYPTQDFANCPGAGFPTCLTDSQLQAELRILVAAHSLPIGTGPNAPIYFMITPPAVDVCAPDGSTPVPCADNTFCAYHSATPYGGSNVLYAAIPMLPLAPGQNAKSCQHDGNTAVQEPNGDGADVAMKYMSHEDNEVITDPLGNAWYDSFTANENGDNCNVTGASDPGAGRNPNTFLPTLGGDASAGTLYDQVINGNPYYVQSEWSNGDVSCDMRPATGAINASFNAPPSAPVGAQITFNPSTSTSTQGYTSVTWNFGDGSPPLFRAGAGPPTSVSHPYGTAGAHTVSLTLVDTLGNLSTTSQTVVVGSAPVARLKFSPAKPGSGTPVRFTGRGSSDPDSGVSISSYSWNFGDGSRAASGVAPSHSYAAVGTYTVTLTVTNSLGLSASTSRPVPVDESPTAGFAVRTPHPASGQPVLFTASSSRDPDGSSKSYSWSFGDHTPSGRGVGPRHTYRSPGTYTVTLTVTDSSGVSATVMRRVGVALAGKITAIKTTRNRHGTFLVLTLNAPGTLTIDSRRFRIRKAETAKFKLTLSPALLSRVRARGKLAVKIKLVFTPTAGIPFKKTVMITVLA